MNDFSTALTIYFREMAQGFAIKGPLAGLAALLSGGLGGVDQLLTMLMVLMILDFALGFWRGCRTHCVSLAKLKSGILKFVFYAMAVMVFACLEVAQSQSSGGILHLPVRDLMVAYLCVTEALSALDHLAFFGVPVPAWLVARLRDYRDGCPLAKRSGGADA